MPETILGASAETPEQTFDLLVQVYYRAWFRFHPERAVDVGVPGFASQLRPYGDDDIAALVCLNEKLLVALDGLDVPALEPDRRLDYQVLYGAALIEIHELRDADWRFHDPGRFLPLNALNQLLLRPVDGFAQALKARLCAIPGYLRGARAHLSKTPELIPIVWLDSAVHAAEAGAGFVRGLDKHPKVRRSVGRVDSLRAWSEAAANALSDFARFLEKELAPRCEGDFACGRVHYERLLRYRHGLPVGAAELLGFGQRLFDQTSQALRARCRALRGDEDCAALLAQIQRECPASDPVLDGYRQSLKEAKAFVLAQDLVSIPPQQKLKVMKTPDYLRHQIPFAAYVKPTSTDPEQCGYYYVTPAATAPDVGKQSRLSIAQTSVHEAWPGHHLQCVTANGRYAARSLVRQLNASATLYEGWALYSEELMQARGFLAHEASPFLLLRDRLWRAQRVILDVQLHTGRQSLDLAVESMRESLGFSYSHSMGELSGYSAAPGEPMGYATGWALIRAAREHVEAEDANFTEKAFHDRLLASGSVALPWVIQRQFSDGLWQAARRRVFESSAAIEPL